MRVIPPITITDAILTSSTATEPGTGETAYAAGTTYALGDTCSVIGTNSHIVYQSLQAGNIGHTPATSPTYWIAVGPTNRWKMFDTLRNTQTVSASPLTVVLTPGMRCNSIAVMGMVADSITVTVTSGGSTVYTYTKDLRTRDVTDWYAYYFDPFTSLPGIVLFALPPYTNAIITVTMTISSGNVSCGAIVVGNSEYLGDMQYNAKDDVLNFSTITRDAYGTATLVARRNVPKTIQALWLDKSKVKRVADIRDSLNAVPAVWSGIDDPADGFFNSFLILGIYKTFSLDASGPNTAVVNLELEEI